MFDYALAMITVLSWDTHRIVTGAIQLNYVGVIHPGELAELSTHKRAGGKKIHITMCKNKTHLIRECVFDCDVFSYKTLNVKG